jgi:integrase
VAAGQSRRRIPSTAAIEERLDQVIEEDPPWGWVFAMVATDGLRPHEVWHIDGLPDEHGLITIGVAARHIKVTKTGFRAVVPLPATFVERYQLRCLKLRSSDAKAEFELKTKLYAWVEVAEGRKKAQKRKKRCVRYDLRHAYAIRARETTSWSYADVAAVMGHSSEVRRLLGDEQVA